MHRFKRIKLFSDPWLDSEKIEFSDKNIDELSNTQHNQLLSTVKSWTYEGSDWTINSIIQHQLVISEIASCEGTCYFPFPTELRNPMKDNECFRWCLVRYLNPVNKNPAKIRNVNK